MTTELLRVRTADGIALDGCLMSPEVIGSQRATDSVEVWLLVHGTGGNFYSPGVLETFAAQMAGTVPPRSPIHSHALRVNTRGHDVISSLTDGAAFESIADCVHDLQAWLDELVRRGFQRIGLVGHSMGGVKVIYSQAHAPHPHVVAIVGLSPPRFCHAEWQTSPLGQPFREDYQRAQDLVASGRADELMLVQQPLPLWFTASGFLAKYGPHDDYDFVPLLPKLSCPTLIMVGTESIASSPAFASVPAAIAACQRSHANVQLQIVPGANTGYSGHREVPGQLTLAWMNALH